MPTPRGPYRRELPDRSGQPVKTGDTNDDGVLTSLTKQRSSEGTKPRGLERKAALFADEVLRLSRTRKDYYHPDTVSKAIGADLDSYYGLAGSSVEILRKLLDKALARLEEKS